MSFCKCVTLQLPVYGVFINTTDNCIGYFSANW